MSLKYLEKDDRVPYIAETIKTYKNAGIEIRNDLYKNGKKPALLVVDLQRTFTSPESPLGTRGVSDEVAEIVNGVVENTRVLLDTMRRKQLPIIFITSVHNEEGTDGGMMGMRAPMLIDYAKRGSKWIEIDSRLDPNENDLRVEKKVPSAFIGTNLHQLLTFNRVDTCIITGLSISSCVRQHAIDAMSYGFYTVLPEECVGDRGIGPGKANLFDLGVKFVDVTNLVDVIDWLDNLQ